MQRLKEIGLTLTIASSTSKKDLRALLRQAEIDDLIELAVTADQVQHSKPDPDVVQTALAESKVSNHQAVMLGDTPYDISAAQQAGVPVIALTCGGWSAADLHGAAEIYASPADLLAHLGSSIILRGPPSM